MLVKNNMFRAFQILQRIAKFLQLNGWWWEWRLIRYVSIYMILGIIAMSSITCTYDKYTVFVPSFIDPSFILNLFIYFFFHMVLFLNRKLHEWFICEFYLKITLLGGGGIPHILRGIIFDPPPRGKKGGLFHLSQPQTLL